MTRTVRRLISGLFLLVAVGLAAVFVVPTALGYEIYVITTGSMAGTADPGALVLAKPVPVEQLAVGNVITYAPPPGTGIDHLVTHRITDISTDRAGDVTYRTKGDANAAVDPWTFTLQSDVQPRMRWSIPTLGRPVLWLADRDTRMLAIGVPSLLIALMALRDLVRGLRPARRRPEADAATVDVRSTVIDLTTPAATTRTA